MTIRDVLMAVRQRWWALVVCVVVCGGIGVGAAVLPAATYSSTAGVVVAVPGVDQSSLQLPGGLSVTQRATNYQTLATGSEVLQAVIDKTGLDTTPAKLAGQIATNVPAGTTIVQITATADTAAGAQQLAQAVAAQLSATADPLEKSLGIAEPKAVLSVADPAPLPLQHDPRGTAQKGALGLIVGLIIGAGLLWFLEYADGSVRKPEDLAVATGAAVLGTLGRGRADHAPATGRDAEAIHTVRAALRARGANVVVVAAATGAEPAPNLAADLAVASAAAGRRTLLIDGDLDRAAITTLLGLQRSPGLAEALAGGTAAAVQAASWGDTAVEVVTAGSAAGGSAAAALDPERLRSLLDGLGDYAAVVIAAPPVLTSVAAATLGAVADGVVIAASWGATSIRQACQARDRAAIAEATVLGFVLADVPAYRARGDAGFVPARA